MCSAHLSCSALSRSFATKIDPAKLPGPSLLSRAACGTPLSSRPPSLVTQHCRTGLKLLSVKSSYPTKVRDSASELYTTL